MSKLVGSLLAGISVLAFSGTVMGAKTSKAPFNDQIAAGGAAGAGTAAGNGNTSGGVDPESPRKRNARDTPSGKKASRETTRRTDDTLPTKDYSADLRKCDALPGSDKTQCITAAKKKHGQL
jgi:hypothetical protein